MDTQSWLTELTSHIHVWSHELGFLEVGISEGPTDDDASALSQWLTNGHQGDMAYMTRWGTARAKIDTLVLDAIRVISVTQAYYPQHAADPWQVLNTPQQAYISRYALNRDYHKTMRTKLARLADRIEAWTRREVPTLGEQLVCRAMVDSAPLMEKPAAREAGLGFIGRNTNLINAKKGSWFFIGELVTNIPLPINQRASAHCGTCTACVPACPTGALSKEGQIDARRCISYLTIEHPGPIPLEWRSAMGNRIYGCDDCQLVCPFNSFNTPVADPDFNPRLGLDRIELLTLWAWSEAEFLKNLEGSPIRRIGYERFSRNLAIALGNAPHSPRIVAALRARRDTASDLLKEHIDWAIDQHQAKSTLERGDRGVGHWP